MRRNDCTITPAAATGIAGTLMALVAVAATAAAVPAPAASPNQCRAAVMDSQPLRAVAAVVAAACDLLGIERTSDAPAAQPLPFDDAVQFAVVPPIIEPTLDEDSPPLFGGMREALLNLPPPIC